MNQGQNTYGAPAANNQTIDGSSGVPLTNQSTYGAPGAAGQGYDNNMSTGLGNNPQQAQHGHLGHTSSGVPLNDQSTYGAPGATGQGYDNNLNNNTTGLGTHPQQVHHDRHGHHGNHGHENNHGKEGLVDKIKDHLRGDDAQNPKSGGGFGAGYTGNQHGHTNHHPQPDTRAEVKEAQASHPSLLDKAKAVLHGQPPSHQEPATHYEAHQNEKYT